MVLGDAALEIRASSSGEIYGTRRPPEVIKRDPGCRQCSLPKGKRETALSNSEGRVVTSKRIDEAISGDPIVEIAKAPANNQTATRQGLPGESEARCKIRPGLPLSRRKRGSSGALLNTGRDGLLEV